MTSKKIYSIILLMAIARIGISLIVSDGKLRSDGLNYFGLSANVILKGTVSSIQPVDETKIQGGISVQDYLQYIEKAQSPYRRLMNFQWLHAVLFIPVILLFKSLYAIIVVNNILFVAAGYFIFDSIQSLYSKTTMLCSWMLYLFFPPFFYLTNQFFSEPLFIFLLAVLINHLVQNKNLTTITIILLIALTLTRGFGLFCIASFILVGFVLRKYQNVVIVMLCGIVSILINFGIGVNLTPKGTIKIESPPPLLHSIYFSNTTNGNGDNDLFLIHPEKADADTFFAQYKKGVYSSTHLLLEIGRQNMYSPKIGLRNAWNKIGEYFLSIIPDSWNYNNTPNQPLYKKLLWGIQNLALLCGIFYGWKFMSKNFRMYYGWLFCISLCVHYIALSRYRYFQPILLLGFPAISSTIDIILSKILPRTDKKRKGIH